MKKRRGSLNSMTTGENKMVLFNIMSTVLVAGINFFTIPVFTRVLSTEGYGIVNVYTAWMQICTVFVGLKADGSVGSAKANLPEDEQDSYHLSVLVLGLLSFAVVMVLLLVFMPQVSALLNMEPMLVVAMALQSLGTFVVSLFSMRFIFRKQAQRNLLVSVGVCVATTAASLLLISLVFTGGDGYRGRVLGLSLPYLLIGLALFAWLAATAHGRVRLSYWRFCLALTLPLIFHGLSQIALAQIGRISVQRVEGYSAAGVYSIAVTVVSVLSSIYNALNNAFVPFMYDDLAGKTGDGVKRRHFRNYTLLFTLGCCAFALMAPEVLKILSTEEYWGAVSLLPPLVVGQYCVFLYSFPVNYEFYAMRTRSVAVGTALAALLDFALAVALVPALGMMGAALATMFAYLALFLFHFLIARYAMGDRNYPARAFAAGLAAVLAACALCYPLDGLPVIRWIAGAALLAAAFGRVIRNRTIF